MHKYKLLCTTLRQWCTYTQILIQPGQNNQLLPMMRLTRFDVTRILLGASQI